MNALFRRDKVVIIVNSLLMNAGVERRTLDFATFLQARGLTVEVCVLREAGKIVPLFEQAGIPVLPIKVYDYDAHGGYVFHPAGFLRLASHLLRSRSGMVFCVQPPSSIFGRLACLPPLGRRIVAMERYLVSGRSKRRLRLDRWMARWSRIVCVSTLLQEELAAESGIPAGEIAVIEDGVAIAPPADPQTELRRRLAGRFVFGYVGLLTKRKRPALLIEAFAALLAGLLAGTGAALVIVGGGEDEEELKRLATALNVAEEVIFVGEQIHVHDFYPLFDCFVFPSVGEGLGNVWAEAMQHGLPVICADVRPMSDYIRHRETGLLARPDDAKALAREMRVLMESEPLRRELGERGRQFACDHFDSERQMQKLLDAALRPGQRS
jgi:glycosyltransferase involved in cell wall biosynthesis